jgi:peptidoglycan/LPS O-acetylase OafA/YrhL
MTSHGPASAGQQRAVTALGYLLLFILGALQGFVGSFQYSRSPAPLIAIVLAVAIFLTCLGCGWGIGTFTAGLLPAVGWILASFILAMGRPNGSVIITATTAGECYLYGGALGCAAGAVGTVFIRARRSSPGR